MTRQTRNKIINWHTALKPYYSLIAIVLSTATLSWEITHAAIAVITGDTKELHANTEAVAQISKDLLEQKTNTAAAFGEIKADDKLRDARIQQNTLDIKGLLTENKKR